MQTATKSGMNGSNGIVSGSLCFAPLDDRDLDAGNTITSLVVVDGGFEYSADPLERMLDRYCVKGSLLSAADLADVPDDRGELVEVRCWVRMPAA